MPPAFVSELLLLFLPMFLLAGLWLGPPLLAYWLGNLLYAAYARAVGLPKPEKGYDLFDVCGRWLVAAFLAWSWVAWRFALTHRETVDLWIRVVDGLFL